MTRPLGATCILEADVSETDDASGLSAADAPGRVSDDDDASGALFDGVDWGGGAALVEGGGRLEAMIEVDARWVEAAVGGGAGGDTCTADYAGTVGPSIDGDQLTRPSIDGDESVRQEMSR